MLIWLHLVMAGVALALGAVNLTLPKGTPRHRVIGWIWLAVMLAVTAPSFAIRDLNDGALSWIHGIAAWTLLSMFLAVFFVKTGRIRAHAGFMIGTMAGMVVAGAFAMAPGRFISTAIGY